MLGSILVAIYAGVCLLYRELFVDHFLCRAIVLLLVGWISFGRTYAGTALFFLISVVIDLTVACIENKNSCLLILAILLTAWTFLLTLKKRKGDIQCVPVEIVIGEKRICFQAFRDNGNLLRDSVSGMPVLIVDLRISKEVTGLTRQQLQDPVEVMRHPPIPGLRLITCRTITQSNGILLGKKIPEVHIGRWCGSLVVAFAPEVFVDNGEFEALIGGMP